MTTTIRHRNQLQPILATTHQQYTRITDKQSLNGSTLQNVEVKKSEWQPSHSTSYCYPRISCLLSRCRVHISLFDIMLYFGRSGSQICIIFVESSHRICIMLDSLLGDFLVVYANTSPGSISSGREAGFHISSAQGHGALHCLIYRSCFSCRERRSDFFYR
ncbi:hypothetical protein BD310DRAFT_581459 [Dichomitus squalens]|uniref:Uncharacterized protein n=1 Tax=Dichomitus squalens TaxID=114155 RepID=A0A4Q9Q7H0_9APHY|nr:hypothetical protein BD310DRAFT_581459 [Dichomitus squalens]